MRLTYISIIDITDNLPEVDALDHPLNLERDLPVCQWRGGTCHDGCQLTRFDILYGLDVSPGFWARISVDGRLCFVHQGRCSCGPEYPPFLVPEVQRSRA